MQAMLSGHQREITHSPSAPNNSNFFLKQKKTSFQNFFRAVHASSFLLLLHKLESCGINKLIASREDKSPLFFFAGGECFVVKSPGFAVFFLEFCHKALCNSICKTHTHPSKCRGFLKMHLIKNIPLKKAIAIADRGEIFVLKKKKKNPARIKFT